MLTIQTGIFNPDPHDFLSVLFRSLSDASLLSEVRQSCVQSLETLMLGESGLSFENRQKTKSLNGRWFAKSAIPVTHGPTIARGHLIRDKDSNLWVVLSVYEKSYNMFQLVSDISENPAIASKIHATRVDVAYTEEEAELAIYQQMRSKNWRLTTTAIKSFFAIINPRGMA